MRRNPLTPPRHKHGANRSAAAAMVVGAGLACAAGSSWGNPLSAGDIADVPDMALTSASPARPDDPTSNAEAVPEMTGWKPADEKNLNAMRGGFDGKDAQALEASASPPAAESEGSLQSASQPGAAESAPVAARADQLHASEPEAGTTTVSRTPVREERIETVRGGFKAATARPASPADPVGKALPLVSREPDGAAPPSRSRSRLATWKPVAEERLDELRGGFDVGGLQASFGIERAVFINGSLVVSTSLTIPDISKITTAQASQLAAALAPIANVGAVASTAAAASGSAGTAGAAAASTAASSGTAAALPVTVIPTTNGTVVTNGQQLVVQNGLNNTLVTGAQGTSPATIIQNTLNGQSIQSLTTINVGVNTLQAYRAAVASTVLNDTLLNAAGRR